MAGRLTAQRSVEEIALDGTLTVDEPEMIGRGGRGREPVDLPRRGRERYELVAEHARGGLGTVLRAYDRELGRTVAIKELLSDGVSVESRFLREAFITARLEHPSIVPVHDAGRWPDGRPFYAMKLVGGRSLKEAIREADGLVERMGLLPNLIAVADAIAYAHSRGIIHRDLKPANVLVGEYGETVVVDWGLAKDLDASVPGAAVDAGPFRAPAPGGLTMIGTVMGTPAFMPPEQAAGEEVDERADVYAIGAMLYDLIAGGAPYAGLTAEQIVEAVRAAPPQPLAEREPAAPLDLVAIVERAMARDPGDRYGDAGELAADLRRFQRGQFVRARHYTPAARARRWLSRHRALVTVAGAALAVVVVVAAYSVNRVVRERDEATAQRARAEDALSIAQTERNNLLLTQAESALDRDPTEALDWLRRYREGEFDWQRASAIAADAMSRGVAKHVLHGHDGRTTALAIGPDHQMLTASTDGTVRRWDLRTGEGEVVARGVPRTIHLHATHDREWAVSYPDGNELVLLNLRDGSERRALIPDGRVLTATFSPDGRELVVGATHVGLYRWALDGTAGPEKVHGATGDVYLVRHAADGSRWAAASFDGSLTVWRRDSGHLARLARTDGLVTAVAFSPSGDALASVDTDGIVAIYDLATAKRRVVAQLPAVDIAATRAALPLEDAAQLEWIAGADLLVCNISPVGLFAVGLDDAEFARQLAPEIDRLGVETNGTRIAYALHEGVVEVLELASGSRMRLAGHRGDVALLAFSPDGALVSAGSDSAPRLWTDAITTHRAVEFHLGAPVLDLSVTGPRELLAVAKDGLLRRLNIETQQHDEIGAHAGILNQVSVDATRARATTAGLDAGVALWNLTTGTRERMLQGATNVAGAAISSDGAWVAVVDSAGGVGLWRWDGQQVWHRSAHEGEVSLVAFRSERSFVTAGADGVVLEWSLAGDARAVFRHEGVVEALAVSARTGAIASAGRDGRVLTLRPDGRVRVEVQADTWMTALAFAPDGDLLVGGSREGRLYLCVERSPCDVLNGHRAFVAAVAVSTDSRLIASVAFDGSVRLWRADGSAASVLQPFGALLIGVEFSPDGAFVSVSDSGGVVRAWPVEHAVFVPANSESLFGWLLQFTDKPLGARRR